MIILTANDNSNLFETSNNSLKIKNDSIQLALVVRTIVLESLSKKIVHSHVPYTVHIFLFVIILATLV